MIHLHQTVGVPGAYETLQNLEASAVSVFRHEQLLAIMQGCGVDHPEATLREFVAANLIRRQGERFVLTTLGIRTALLLAAINGQDLRQVYARLSRTDPSLHAYQLVREGMTDLFLENVAARSGFGRLYFCSPWINLSLRQRQLLAHGILQVERARGNRPEILVVVRPEQGTELKEPPTLGVFRDFGATVFLNPRLHTKLYIREPDRRGGHSMAILGSQNLTKSNYLELGIRISSDGQMITQLIAYFLDLANNSYEA